MSKRMSARQGLSKVVTRSWPTDVAPCSAPKGRKSTWQESVFWCMRPCSHSMKT